MFLSFNLYFAIANVCKRRLESYNLRSIKGKWISVLDILLPLYHLYHFCLWWPVNCWGSVIEKPLEAGLFSSVLLLVVQLLSHVWLFCDPMDCSPPAFCPWDFPGKNTGVGCHSFSRGPSWPRDWACVSCIGRWILFQWVPREAPLPIFLSPNKWKN